MPPPKNSFCFAPQHNHPPHRGDDGLMHPSYDATGAFLPYMEEFRKLYSATGTVTTLTFNNHASAKNELKAIADEISHALNVAQNRLDAVVYFGHGWPTGMVSADIYTQNIPDFAQLIRANCARGVTIVLYACLCGQVNAKGGCFASRLANELSDIDAVVFAHDNAGHTATNPNVYRYSGNKPGVPVAPAGMFHSFDVLLKAESIDKKPKGNTAFWARMPFMTDDEIAAEVKGYKGR
jgi:hypothetical protein